jgi:hypothetical protein
MSERSGFGWLPPFLVGLATAIAAEVSVGLLLYTGEGFLRATTLLLATLLGAFSLGLWSAPRWEDDRTVAAIRRRWLLALVAYAVGASTTAAWTMMGGLASSGFTRGLGLALLAGGPMYGSGVVLGTLSGGAMVPTVSIGAPAAAGTAFGVVVTGWILVPYLAPLSMYAVSLVALTGGAAVHGFVLGGRSEWRLVDEEPSLFGTVRVSDRVWGRPRRVRRTLTVGGRIAGGTENGRAFRAWERAAASWVPERLRGNGEGPGPVLLIGASAVALQGRLRGVGAPLTVVERNPVVWRMTVRHLGEARTAEGTRVETGDVLEKVLEEVPGRFEVVVADGSGWEGSLTFPSASLIGRVRRALRPGGLFVIGADDPRALESAEAARDIRGLFARAGFSSFATFTGVDAEGPGGLLLIAGSADTHLPDQLPEMTRVALPEDLG